jgi:cell division inhibitor SulA
MLKYTPQKGKATLRITKAVSVKAEQTELETARKREAERLYGNYFDLITVEGKLSVNNLQQKAITLEITKTLSGEVKASEPKAAIEKQARGLRRMNGIVKLAWTIELGPGEHKDLSYKYEVYVRR